MTTSISSIPLTYVNELYAILQDGVEKSKEVAYCHLVILLESKGGAVSKIALKEIHNSYNWDFSDRLLCWFFDVLLNYKEEY